MKRWLVRICVFLVLLLVGGAMINFAVPWGCTRLAYAESGHYPAAISASWPVPVAAHWPATCNIWRSRSLGACVEICSGYGQTGALFQVFVREFGFPRSCLMRTEGFEIDAAMVTRQSFNTRLRVLWPGFAINTVFYAAILWGLFAAPFALRRRLRDGGRRRRGLCVKCGYDLRGAGSAEGPDAITCPECGPTR